jgi:hypothetical protein
MPKKEKLASGVGNTAANISGPSLVRIDILKTSDIIFAQLP